MKTFPRFRLWIFVCVIVVSALQGIGQITHRNIPLQQTVSLDEIITKLKAASRSKRKQVNKNLIADVTVRGIGFVWKPDNLQRIRKAGGSWELLDAIYEANRKASATAEMDPEEKALLEEYDRLSGIIRENYSNQSPDRLVLAINAGEVLVEKFYGLHDSELILWVKNQLPKWRERLVKINKTKLQ